MVPEDGLEPSLPKETDFESLNAPLEKRVYLTGNRHS